MTFSQGIKTLNKGNFKGKIKSLLPKVSRVAPRDILANQMDQVWL